MSCVTAQERALEGCAWFPQTSPHVPSSFADVIRHQFCVCCVPGTDQLSVNKTGSCPHGVSILVKAVGSKPLRSL